MVFLAASTQLVYFFPEMIDQKFTVCPFSTPSTAADELNYYFSGGGWVITRIKANLSSTELGLTSQLELSLAIRSLEGARGAL